MAGRPHMYPLDFDSSARKKIRELVESKGLEISGIEAIHAPEMWEKSSQDAAAIQRTAKGIIITTGWLEPMFTHADEKIRR